MRRCCSEYRSWKTDGIYQATFRGLVDFAELLAATKSTGHLVFDPRCLCGDKLLACLYWTKSMILFQSREFDHRLVKALSKFCINSTSIYSEHPASRAFLQNLDGDIHWIGYPLVYADVVALKQVEYF
jgi:hypothetical protein